MIEKNLNPFADSKKPDDSFEMEQSTDQSEEIFLNIKAGANLKLNKQLPPSNKLQAFLSLLKQTEFNFANVKLQDKVIFYELMATMLQAGLPIVEALDIAGEQTASKPLRKILEKANVEIEMGSSFSQALKKHPKSFPEAETGVIESGEATGQIDKVFGRLSREMEKSYLIRSKVKGALIYPAVVLVFIVVTIYIMLAFVIPEMTKLLVEAGLELPLLTKLVIGLSDFVVNNGFSLILGTALGVIAFIIFKANPAGRYILHQIILTLPICKKFSAFTNQAIFARNLSSLMSAGVSITRSLKIAAKAVTNAVYKKHIEALAEDVSQGISLETSLANSKYFSKLTYNLLAVGEKTAQIDDLASKIADYYETKVIDMADNLSKLLQPIIIAVVGAIVAVVALAVMLPLSQLVGNVGQL